MLKSIKFINNYCDRKIGSDKFPIFVDDDRICVIVCIGLCNFSYTLYWCIYFSIQAFLLQMEND